MCSDAIVKLRNVLGLTQDQFALKLGVTVTSISRYENGRSPNRQMLKKLADCAGWAHQPDLCHFFERTSTKPNIIAAPTKPRVMLFTRPPAMIPGRCPSETASRTAPAFRQKRRLGTSTETPP